MRSGPSDDWRYHTAGQESPDMSKRTFTSVDLAGWTTWGCLRWASAWPVVLPWWVVKWPTWCCGAHRADAGGSSWDRRPAADPCTLRDLLYMAVAAGRTARPTKEGGSRSVP